MRGGAREAYALFNEGPLFCCYSNRREENERQIEKKGEMYYEKWWTKKQNKEDKDVLESIVTAIQSS